MSWISITADNLEAYLVAAQLTALRTEALDAGQADPFTEIMPDIVRKVRGYIASNPVNLLDTSELTIPPELKADVCYLIIAPMLGRLGIALTDDQRDQVKLAHTTLVALREKKLVVSRPLNPVVPDVQSAGGVETVTPASGRKYTTEKLDGL